jgi:hypothetical protein
MPAMISIFVYLTQWLKIASGDRVHLCQRGQVGLSDFLVFKCKVCKDNWHVGVENFNGTSIPQVLEDWVKKHRHVCSKYTNTHGVMMGTCSMCGWRFEEHPVTWGDYNVKYTDTSEKSVKEFNEKQIKAFNESQVESRIHTVYKEKPLPIFKGRKFRDSEEE